MNTRQLTRSAMLCALYGLILFLNSVSALSVETYFPFLMAVPILADAAMYSPRISMTSFAAMAVMTFILSSMTTWLYAISYLLAGLVFGIGIYQKRSPLISCAVCMAVLFACNYLTLTVFAAVFGYDPSEAQMLAAALGNLVPWQTLLVLMALLLGFTQTIVIYCIALIMMERMHIPMQQMRLPAVNEIPPWYAWGFPVSAGLLALVMGLRMPQWVISACLLLFLFFLVGMVYAGSQILLQKIRTRAKNQPQAAFQSGSSFEKSKSSRKKQRSPKEFWLIFLLVFTAFIPGIDLFHAVVGFFSVIHHAKTRHNTKVSHKQNFVKGDSDEKIQ